MTPSRPCVPATFRFPRRLRPRMPPRLRSPTKTSNRRLDRSVILTERPSSGGSTDEDETPENFDQKEIGQTHFTPEKAATRQTVVDHGSSSSQGIYAVRSWGSTKSQGSASRSHGSHTDQSPSGTKRPRR